MQDLIQHAAQAIREARKTVALMVRGFQRRAAFLRFVIQADSGTATTRRNTPLLKRSTAIQGRSGR
jgi:hypothetical protein